MAEPFYLSRFRLTGALIDATVDTVNHNDIPIPDGLYYLDSATAAESLAAAIDAALEGAYATEDFTVTYSTTTGKFTFSCTTLAGNWALTFKSTLGTIVGYGAGGGSGPAAGAAQVATNLAQYAIFAGSGRSSWEGRESDVPNVGHRSTSGKTFGVGSANELFAASWLHAHERAAAQTSPLESGTRDDADAVDPWVWQDFFRHHRQTHHPFRFYEAAGAAINAYEDVYKLDGPSLGRFMPKNQEEGSWYYWKVPLHVVPFR